RRAYPRDPLGGWRLYARRLAARAGRYRRPAQVHGAWRRLAGDGADLAVVAAAGRTVARRQPRHRRALRSPDLAGGIVPMLWRGGRADQPRRRSLPDDDLFGQPRTPCDGALFLPRRARLDAGGHRPRSSEQGYVDLRRADRRALLGRDAPARRS